MYVSKSGVLTKLILFLFAIFYFENCLDTFTYTQTNKKSKQSISPLVLGYALYSRLSSSSSSSSSTSTSSTSSEITLTISDSSATGANSFVAAVYNSSGLRVGGITGNLSSSKTYTGTFKSVDSTSGAVSTSNATFSTGTHYYGIYIDSDGSGTINVSGDKVYYSSFTNTSSANLAGIVISDSNFITPSDVEIQYTVGDLTAYNGKIVYCYILVPGIASSISTTAGINSILKTHGISIAATAVNSGYFDTTHGVGGAKITTTLSSLGTTWSTSHFVRFVQSGYTADVFCWVDNTANGYADTGEPYFRASSVSLGTITVSKIGTF